MGKKTSHSKFLFDDVSPGMDIWDSPVIPDGRVVTVKLFGGSVSDAGASAPCKFALLWGTAGSFTPVRGAMATMQWENLGDFVGDGSKHFRIVRENTQIAGDRPIMAWLEALVHDQ